VEQGSNIERQENSRTITLGRLAVVLNRIHVASACARSDCDCCTSQLWSLPPKTFESLTAISKEMLTLAAELASHDRAEDEIVKITA
jgi:hypothetical protein